MGGRVLSELKDRITVVLNRPVVTESDKKTVLEVKTRISTEWNGRVLSESNRKTVSVAKARIAAQVSEVKGRTGDSMKSLHGSADRAGAGMRRLLANLNGRVPSGLKKKVIAGCREFTLWLRTPVTVRSALFLMAIWTLALISPRLGLLGTYVGYTSGYGAVILTALTTARLTAGSQKLWAPRPPPQESAAEVERQITETGAARKGIVLREIEQFFESDVRIGPRELNLKREIFLMRKRDWQMLQNTLYDTFLKGAPPLLYELGHRLGSSVGRDLRGISQKPAVILSHLEEVSRALGWGILTVHGDLSRGTKLVFRMQESPFCIADSPLEKNMYSCHLVNGLVTGIAEEIYGWPCSVFERKCARDGHGYCEMVVTQAANPTKPKDRWNLSVLFPTLHPWVRP